MPAVLVLALATAALPADAARVAARIDACMHFAGELNGDGSSRDRDIAHAMDRLHCNRIRRDAEAVRRRYPHDAAVDAAMHRADEL